MRKEHIPLPRPRSSYLQVQCTNCGNEQIIFSSPTTDMRCKVCDALLAQRTGGKARIAGVILRRVD